MNTWRLTTDLCINLACILLGAWMAILIPDLAQAKCSEPRTGRAEAKVRYKTKSGSTPSRTITIYTSKQWSDQKGMCTPAIKNKLKKRACDEAVEAVFKYLNNNPSLQEDLVCKALQPSNQVEYIEIESLDAKCNNDVSNWREGTLHLKKINIRPRRFICGPGNKAREYKIPETTSTWPAAQGSQPKQVPTTTWPTPKE